MIKYFQENILVIVLVLLTLLLLYSMMNNETFEDKADCTKIPKGKCTSELCPSHCKPTKTSDESQCYCVPRE
jgi:hypothetical protein